MIGWLKIALVAAAAVTAIFATVLVIVFRRCSLWRQNSDVNPGEEAAETPRLHQVSPDHYPSSVREGGYQLFHRGTSAKQEAVAFDWADHPALVTDAVENGWSRFAFTSFVASSSPSVRSLMGPCAEPNVEVGWEVADGSADFMQRISLNMNPMKIGSGLSVIRAALPLPGPNLGNSSFPQEAYFEIRIVSCVHTDHLSGDKITRLIGVRNSPDFVIRGLTSHSHSHSQKRAKVGEVVKQDGIRNDAVSMSVGLSAGGPLLIMKSPGTYRGSIAFDSTGSVHLDGIKIISDSIKNEWGRSDRVIGCGYNPSQKRVFFTVDSQLVHDIHCMSDEFSSPLYPTISASTANAVVLVNLGQRPFKFAQANLQRTPNPCFIGSQQAAASSPVMRFEDSRELFSIGRIDEQWRLPRNATRNNINNNSTMTSRGGVEYDQESESDLFEIVLQETTAGRSPYTAAVHQQ